MFEKGAFGGVMCIYFMLGKGNMLNQIKFTYVVQCKWFMGSEIDDDDNPNKDEEKDIFDDILSQKKKWNYFMKYIWNIRTVNLLWQMLWLMHI